MRNVSQTLMFTSCIAQSLMKEQTEAAMAVTGLIDGFEPHELQAAHKETSEAIDAGKRTLAMIEAHMALDEKEQPA